MKFTILVVIFIALLNLSDSASETCELGALTKEGCWECICSKRDDNGKGLLFCDNLQCDKEKAKKCVPNSIYRTLVKGTCRSCLCNEKGISYCFADCEGINLFPFHT